MKFAAFITTTFFLLVNPGLVSGASLRAGSTDEDSSTHRRLGQLRSKQCAPMMQQKMADVHQLVSKYTTAEVIDYVCNPVQRKKKADKQQEMEDSMETQTDPCVKAFMREMAKKKQLVLQAMSSKEACEEEIAKEVQALKSTKKVGAVNTRGADDDGWFDELKSTKKVGAVKTRGANETRGDDDDDVLSDIGDGLEDVAEVVVRGDELKSTKKVGAVKKRGDDDFFSNPTKSTKKVGAVKKRGIFDDDDDSATTSPKRGDDDDDDEVSDLFDDAEKDADDVGDGVEGAADDVGDGIEHAADDVGDAAGDAANAVGNAASDVGGAVEAAAPEIESAVVDAAPEIGDAALDAAPILLAPVGL